MNKVKRQQPFTVVIGNPPYSVVSSNMGQWIVELCEVYKTAVRSRERQIQALSDDYVKFFRLSLVCRAKQCGCPWAHQQQRLPRWPPVRRHAVIVVDEPPVCPDRESSWQSQDSGVPRRSGRPAMLNPCGAERTNSAGPSSTPARIQPSTLAVSDSSSCRSSLVVHPLDQLCKLGSPPERVVPYLQGQHREQHAIAHRARAAEIARRG